MRTCRRTQKQLTVLFCCILIFYTACRGEKDGTNQNDGTYSALSEAHSWIDKPQDQWPQITMINQIDYIDKFYPVAGCGFLLDVGGDTLVITAKHILTYFKSGEMSSVDFEGTLKTWKLFPKNNPADVVVVDQLININKNESIDKIPSQKDWLLFTIKEKSPHIKPLLFRTEPLVEGEKVFIIGWRYSDKDCPQVVHEGKFVKEEEGSILIATEVLADNTMPGLSGSPVVDSKGYLIGLMSKKAGKMERLASIEYPKNILNETVR